MAVGVWGGGGGGRGGGGASRGSRRREGDSAGEDFNPYFLRPRGLVQIPSPSMFSLFSAPTANVWSPLLQPLYRPLPVHVSHTTQARLEAGGTWPWGLKMLGETDEQDDKCALNPSPLQNTRPTFLLNNYTGLKHMSFMFSCRWRDPGRGMSGGFFRKVRFSARKHPRW